MTAVAFPYKLEDLRSWTVRRTDGTITKFILTTVDVSHAASKDAGKTAYSGSVSSYVTPKASLSAYCSHVPKGQKDAIFSVDADKRLFGINAPLSLYVGGISAKHVKDQFDFVIDGGNIISACELPDKMLEGDEPLVSSLKQHIASIPGTRVLKINWFDRSAPKLAPQFWVDLNKQLYGDVMAACQGGHGRSGTAFVCLLLVNAPDYNALDAIIHLRAVHCPRAIESKEQHEYINTVATYLGREANATDLGSIHNYKDAFLEIDKLTAKVTREQLGW